MGRNRKPHKAQYKLEYTARGWEVSLTKVLKPLRTALLENFFQEPIKALREPPLKSAREKFTTRRTTASQAFEQAHKLFLPHLPLDKAAWKKHDEILVNLPPLTRGKDGKIDEDLAFERFAKLMPRKTWPMAWYWKATFQIMHAITKNDEQYKDFTFHIHQVRQWVLLTITKTKNGRRVLAAPPMFGRSERLHSWDQYALYLPFFDEIAHHFQDIKDTFDKSSPVRELELAMAIGRHDVEYTVSKFSHNQTDGCYYVSLDARFNPKPYHERFPFKRLVGDQKGHTPSFVRWKELKTSSLLLWEPYGLARVPVFPNPSFEKADTDSNGCLSFLLSSDRY